jgi:uncharacterized circularly permuted ATP-grasp superfamily protein/uncharacterized alpha-E superfamily protein
MNNFIQQGKNHPITQAAREDDPAGVVPVFPEDFSFTGFCSDVLTPEGKTNPHWQGLIAYLNSIGSTELERRWQKARQIMHEHGVAYDIFSDKKETDRPWGLDPVPFPVPAETWEFLEKGIGQRTRLLTAIYTDIYGKQTLIRNKHLPPELLFGNPRFLHQCHGLYGDDNVKLHFNATDLCRFSDGQWRVLADRTQAPSGAGYALENRIILSRILPRMFHSGEVQRLAPFFTFFHHCLMEISGFENREPNIVMLSPGPASSNYFEHVFLSRYLGLTLVESSDLTVRNDAVFLKTLGGLHPVDVILRRIEDASCDPLVFGGSSLLGVSGLIQAVRSGNVAVANPPGSGILETPGLIPFLPELSQLLLGEQLILQDVPTLWCGRTDSLTKVLSRICDTNDPMIISSAFAMSGSPTFDTRELSREQAGVLAAKIKAAPHTYVAQTSMMPCSLPVWDNKQLKHCSATIRMFSCVVPAPFADIGTSDAFKGKIAVMPGALTRVSDNPTPFLINTGEEKGSKDTWCFSSEIVEHKSMIHHFTGALEINRGSDLPSRVADNMLWLGRYVERSEGMLRVIRSVLSRLNSETRLDLIGEIPFLMRAMANLDIISPDVSEPDDACNMRMLETEILKSIFSVRRPGSIRNSLHNIKKVAASVRDRLSNDSWHILANMGKGLARFELHHHGQISEAEDLVNETVLNMSAFAGLALESMTRGMGWRFMDMGRRIERAGYMISLLQSLFSSKGKPGSYDLESLLEVADCTITYHTRYRTTIHMEPVADLLLLDELNPRAVGFQMTSLLEHVEALPRSTTRPIRTLEEKITLDLTTRLRLADISELMEMTRKGSLPKLNQLLEQLKKGLQALSNQITLHYLTRVETEKQLRNLLEENTSENQFSGGKKRIEI